MSRRDSHPNPRPRDSRSPRDQNPSSARPQPAHGHPVAPPPAQPTPPYVQPNTPRPARPQPAHFPLTGPQSAFPPLQLTGPQSAFPPLQLIGPQSAFPPLQRPPVPFARIMGRPAPSLPAGPGLLNADPLHNHHHGNVQVPIQPLTGMNLERFAPFVGGPTVTDMNPTVYFNTQGYPPHQWKARTMIIARNQSPDPPVANDPAFLNEGIPEIDHQLQDVPSMDALLDMGPQRAEATFVAASREQNPDWGRREHREVFWRFWHRAVARRHTIEQRRRERWQRNAGPGR